MEETQLVSKFNPKKIIIIVVGVLLSFTILYLFFQVTVLNSSLNLFSSRISKLEENNSIEKPVVSETMTSTTKSGITTSSASTTTSSSKSSVLSSSSATSTQSSSTVTSDGTPITEKGDKGDKGDTGAQGVQGIQGIPGISGYERTCSGTSNILTGTTGGAGANCASGKKMITYICEDTSNKAYFTGATTDSINASILCRWWNVSGETVAVKACIICGVVQE